MNLSNPNHSRKEFVKSAVLKKIILLFINKNSLKKFESYSCVCECVFEFVVYVHHFISTLLQLESIYKLYHFISILVEQLLYSTAKGLFDLPIKVIFNANILIVL